MTEYGGWWDNGPMSGKVRVAVIATVVVLVMAVVLVLSRRGDESPSLLAQQNPSQAGSTLAPPGTSEPGTTPVGTQPPGSTTTIVGPTPPRPDAAKWLTTIASASGSSVSIFDAPNGHLLTTLASPGGYGNVIRVFEVIDHSRADFYHVMLPTRPNGSTGWVRASEVRLSGTEWSIDIDLSARFATVYKGTKVDTQTGVVVGTPESPTPTGDFYITEEVPTGMPFGVYGPYEFGLSAHSDVYSEFGGGDGQIGLHGTNEPGLIGTAASHGCVRFPNDAITKMAKALPPGTPVHIH